MWHLSFTETTENTIAYYEAAGYKEVSLKALRNPALCYTAGPLVLAALYRRLDTEIRIRENP